MGEIISSIESTNDTSIAGAEADIPIRSISLVAASSKTEYAH
jgi:hypothetical protein